MLNNASGKRPLLDTILNLDSIVRIDTAANYDKLGLIGFQILQRLCQNNRTRTLKLRLFQLLLHIGYDVFMLTENKCMHYFNLHLGRFDEVKFHF